MFVLTTFVAKTLVPRQESSPTTMTTLQVACQKAERAHNVHQVPAPWNTLRLFVAQETPILRERKTNSVEGPLRDTP